MVRGCLCGVGERGSAGREGWEVGRVVTEED